MTPPVDATERLEAWFRVREWTPFAFQRETWAAYRAGADGLVHAPTGTGKTYALWLGPVLEWLHETGGAATDGPVPFRVLWITPLRALAGDTVLAIERPVADLGLPWTVELRTGDTSASVKARQRRRPPTALVTTPESLSILLSYADAPATFRHLRLVVVDEWHELMSTKRGVQTELGLATLRRLAPGVRTWGASATIGNLDEAAATLAGAGPVAPPRLVRPRIEKRVEIETLRPPSIERFPWAGHLGVKLVDDVARLVRDSNATLLFTNTRSQAEIWFQSLLRADRDLVGRLGLHHGSLARTVRRGVERLLAAGELSGVVCTSSLDLGVDFAPVDTIVQIGSPKGIGRLLQRAGRSGHQPGAVSRVVGVPTNALELIEFAAARAALAGGHVERRRPLDRPLDVLVQHVVTRALGGGFDESALKDEVRSTVAFARLTDPEWSWVLDFVRRGGAALDAYPDFKRVVARDDGRHVVDSRRLAQRHRLTIGTIATESVIVVKYASGRRVGTIEEGFIQRLRPGDHFVFAGRVLELVRVRNLVATVKRAGSPRGRVPRWMGGRSPLSTNLARAVREMLGRAAAGRFEGPEMEAVRPILALQGRVSIVPRPDQVLLEHTRSRDGHHVFLFLLEGRLVHEGLGPLLAWRLTHDTATSVSVTGTDWGVELLSRHPLPTGADEWRGLLAPGDLAGDLGRCLNATQLARRRFRGIAQIAGLLTPGFPSMARSARQLQASSDLFFDVFSDYDPENRLLDQARREVLERELEVGRLWRALTEIAVKEIVVVETERLTPFAFPLWAERMRSQYVSGERWSERVRAMLQELETRSGSDSPAGETADRVREDLVGGVDRLGG